MSDIYQRLQLVGEEEDCAEILAILAAMQTGKLKNDLRLLNFYMEVPVSYGAWVETVEEHSAELLVHQVQAVVIAKDKVAILKSSHFPKDVVASVNYVNVEKSRVVLSKLGYALVRADRRMSVRVEMGGTINASFYTQDGKVEGKVHDMSLTGMSLKVEQDPGIPVSERGALVIALPTGTVEVAATLLKVMTVADHYRLVFEIEPSRPTELNISQFIFQRQVEIIKELKEHPDIA